MWFVKALPLIFGLLLFAVFSTGCGTDHSQFRVVHAASDAAANVDATVDGTTEVTDLAFGNVSPSSGYVTVTAGNRRLEVRPTGTTDDLIDSNVNFGANNEYTVVVSGFTTGSPGIAATVLTDDNSAPSSGNVRLRIVYAAPLDGTPDNFDVYIVEPGTDINGISPTIAGLVYGQASSYQSVAPASNQVIFTLEGSKTPVINQTYTLSAGQVRTLIVTNVDGGSGISPTPLVLNDVN